MMYKRLSLLLATALLSTSAMATDNWSGWYVGASVGHGSGNSEARTTLGDSWASESQALRDHVTDAMSADLDPSGGQYGVQIGYNHLFSGGFLLGGELSYTSLSMDDSRVDGPRPTTPFPSLSYTTGNQIEVDDELALRARFGYANGQHLIYGTVGYARVDADMAAGIVSNGNYMKYGSTADNLHGVQFGVGYEYSFGNNWSLRGEYSRTNLEDSDFETAYLPGSSFVTPPYSESINQDLDYDSLRVGVNYRF